MPRRIFNIIWVDRAMQFELLLAFYKPVSVIQPNATLPQTRLTIWLHYNQLIKGIYRCSWFAVKEKGHCIFKNTCGYMVAVVLSNSF